MLALRRIEPRRPSVVSAGTRRTAMSMCNARTLRALGGHQVDVILGDGQRIDGCQLVSGGGGRVTTLWLLVDGADVLVAKRDIVTLVPGSSAKAVALCNDSSPEPAELT